ncbi:ECF transporter S component, partial [Staphylococcus condimenti]
LLNFLFNMGDPIGPVANFSAAVSFLLTAFYVSKLIKGKWNLVIGLIAGTLVMTLILSILNYFVLLPLYGMIMNLSDVVKNLKIIIVSGIIPFNIIKGIAVSAIFLLLYKRLKKALSY